MSGKCTAESFLDTVQKHKMQVLADFGNVRSLHFQKPENRNCYFQITTWPEHLCISGDMGTYVFSRLTDMFEFFRRDELSVNIGYWHEKLVADSKFESAQKYSKQFFCDAADKEFEARPEGSCGVKEYTYHFEWCLFAIVWGIQQYDKLKSEEN
jgi:hypothetical protein